MAKITKKFHLSMDTLEEGDTVVFDEHEYKVAKDFGKYYLLYQGSELNSEIFNHLDLNRDDFSESVLGYREVGDFPYCKTLGDLTKLVKALYEELEKSVEPKFEIGDKVKYVKEASNLNFGIEIGDVGIVKRLVDNGYTVEFSNGTDLFMLKEEIELVEKEKSRKPKFELGDMVDCNDGRKRIIGEILGCHIDYESNKVFYEVGDDLMEGTHTVEERHIRKLDYMIGDVGIAKESTTARQNKYYNRIMDGFAAGMMTKLANDIDKSFIKGRKQSKTQKFMNVIRNTFKSKKQKALEHFSIVDGSGDLTRKGREEFIDYLWATDDKAKKDFVEKIVEAYEEDK